LHQGIALAPAEKLTDAQITVGKTNEMRGSPSEKLNECADHRGRAALQGRVSPVKPMRALALVVVVPGQIAFFRSLFSDAESGEVRSPFRGWIFRRSLKPKRMFRLHVLLLNRMQPVPERKPARDDRSNQNADQKKPTISRQRDQQNRNNNDRDDETRRSPQAESRAVAGFRFHEFILAAEKLGVAPDLGWRPLGGAALQRCDNCSVVIGL
jgi:hypothetical protein